MTCGFDAAIADVGGDSARAMPVLPMSRVSISRPIQRGIVPEDNCGARWMRCREGIHRITLSGYTQSLEVMQKSSAPGQAADRAASHNLELSRSTTPTPAWGPVQTVKVNY